ncbi:MAG: Dabb family protein [Verrucomicrobiales bacterium]|nr:Dabb family protein [Verrucomicrobiales bacterium]
MSKVKHIALVKFKEGTSEQQIEKMFDEILDITETIPGIEDYVSGTNMSPENLNQGYTHGLIMTFTDAAARDAYLTHPEHGRVKALILPQVDASLVFDFEV